MHLARSKAGFAGGHFGSRASALNHYAFPSMKGSVQRKGEKAMQRNILSSTSSLLEYLQSADCYCFDPVLPREHGCCDCGPRTQPTSPSLWGGHGMWADRPLRWSLKNLPSICKIMSWHFCLGICLLVNLGSLSRPSTYEVPGQVKLQICKTGDQSPAERERRPKGQCPGPT